MLLQDAPAAPVLRQFAVNYFPDPTSCQAGTKYLGFSWNLCVNPVACSLDLVKMDSLSTIISLEGNF